MPQVPTTDKIFTRLVIAEQKIEAAEIKIEAVEMKAQLQAKEISKLQDLMPKPKPKPKKKPKKKPKRKSRKRK